MYPEVFPRNAWYVAARSAEVGDGLLSRWILGDPVLLYRTEAGRPVAMVDRCIHRQMPLSLGRRRGDEIECGYHGLTYNTEGICTRIPGATSISERVRVQVFPLYEEFGLVWIWPGQRDLADPGLIPDHHWYTDPGWATVSGTLHMNARAQLMNENLLDLSHLSFLHADSIGSPEVAEAPVTVKFDDRSVTVHRRMPNSSCYPYLTRLTGIDEPIDRVQTAEFIAPSFGITTAMSRPHADADDARACRQKAMHGITPETRTSAHYFWSTSRDYAIDDDSVTEYMAEALRTVILQDIGACEAIEHIIAAWEPSYPVELNIKVDAGPLQARRILERMIAAEQKMSEGDAPAWTSVSDTAARAATQAWAKRNGSNRDEREVH